MISLLLATWIAFKVGTVHVVKTDMMRALLLFGAPPSGKAIQSRGIPAYDRAIIQDGVTLIEVGHIPFRYPHGGQKEDSVLVEVSNAGLHDNPTENLLPYASDGDQFFMTRSRLALIQVAIDSAANHGYSFRHWDGDGKKAAARALKNGPRRPAKVKP